MSLSVPHCSKQKKGTHKLSALSITVPYPSFSQDTEVSLFLRKNLFPRDFYQKFHKMEWSFSVPLDRVLEQSAMPRCTWGIEIRSSRQSSNNFP